LCSSSPSSTTPFGSHASNVVAWATVAALTVLTVLLVVTSLWPGGALLPS
jgi:hypothetical protein